MAVAIAPDRQKRVDQAREAWIRKLIDLSRRNNLLYFRDLKTGTLDISSADAEDMRRLLQSGAGNAAVALSRLVPPDCLDRATSAIRNIADKARSHFEERGLDTLFLALGFATWTAGDGGRDPQAPVLLMPLSIEGHGTRGQGVSLRRAGEIKVNEVLLHALQVEQGIALDVDKLVPEILGDDEGEVFDLQPLFARITQAANRVPGFQITPRWVVGNFSFQKLAIVRDLQELGAELASHDVIAGIAGDALAAEQSRGQRPALDGREIDRRSPEAEFLVLDADSSQQQAIGMTLAGHNLVISGPPGTGKSQTIANLIAEMAAAGKTVLFVAEKRAALDVVLNRLRQVGLGHLCLDLHGADISRREVARQLEQSLNEVRGALEPDAREMHARLVERRDRLNQHERQMHVTRPPSGLSLYQLYGQLSRLPEEARCATRFDVKVLGTLEPEKVERCRDLLRELAGLHDLFRGETASPWNGADFGDANAVRQALERVAKLCGSLWPACEKAIGPLLKQSGVREPVSVSDLKKIVTTLVDIDEAQTAAGESIFKADLAGLCQALAPARSFGSRVFATLFDGAFRSALHEVRTLVEQQLSAPRALELVDRAKTQLRAWTDLGSKRNVPPRLRNIGTVKAALDACLPELSAVMRQFAGRQVGDLRVAELGEWLAALNADRHTPAALLRVHQIVTELLAASVGVILDEIRAGKANPAVWPDMLRHAWLSSWVEEIHLTELAIAGFKGRPHDEIVREFRDLDRQRLQVAVARVRRAHAERAIEVRNGLGEQNAVVAREAQKRARHLPLRQLVKQAPDVLLALRPCWMASPLSVSQLLPGDRQYFDTVIFDEASQVLPEDAITSLLRGRRAVVAGDRRQLPPTTFFCTSDDIEEEEDEASTAGFQSILDVMSAFLDPPASLDWHYRSRDESLIAFSNHHIYDRRLVTFPGPGRWPALSHVLVPFVAGQGGQEDSSGREVERVVRLVIEHAEERPNETLGVIAMGITHANRVQMALEKARSGRPDLDDFFATDKQERFFVKNLERVQGDERDAIILTIGYGKNEAGHLVYRFGPLLQDGGERRLNVAITRARRRMTVVSSFTHADVDPEYPKEGVRLLRAYLEYAASSGRRLDSGTITSVPLNDFEQSVCDELKHRGVKVIGQMGSSRYRIDLVVQHPLKPGRYVLAIECDGASYHSAPTARDRDRLRQQQLEELGWRFHRIWSTDWFLRRDEELDRTLRAIDEAVRYADDQDAAATDQVVAPATATKPITRPVDVMGLVPSQRGPRPSVLPGQPITAYTSWDLRQVVKWVLSDGRLRTDEEILTEVINELGFSRRGSRIVAAIEEAISAVRGR